MAVSDLLKIRALNGSQHYAFEELCCQLVYLEPRQTGTSFIRKGPGADAGVECFLYHADNTETGWQAKFFDNFASCQASQLTESFSHAVKKHPRLWCVVLPKRNKKQFINAIAEQTLIDPHALPRAVHLGDGFVGEYPWHPACSIEDDWKTINWHYRYRGKMLPTVSEIEKGTGGYDYSLEQNLSFYLPAPWLIRKLGMQLVDGRELRFANHAGQTLFKDPSIHEPGPSAALIDKAAFIELLQKNNLSPVWIIAGEKGAYGEHTDDFVGRRVHSFVYELDASDTVVCTRQYVTDERKKLLKCKNND